MGTCLCGLAAQEGDPVFSKNIHADVRCTLSECKEAGIRSFAALPVRQEDEMLGVIGIASRTERDFSEQREFLDTIAATVALAARNALLFERLKNHSDVLENTVRERVRELKEANEKLQEIDRLKSLFIASMSHELRTPLNSIIGFTGILLQELPGPLNQEQRTQLGMVKSSSQHLLGIPPDRGAASAAGQRFQLGSPSSAGRGIERRFRINFRHRHRHRH